MTLDNLSTQPGDCEIILVTLKETNNLAPPPQSQIITVPANSNIATLLNTGANAARGDVLLFLWPGSQLPANGLEAITHNFNLLPQSIGGNFHIKFLVDALPFNLISHTLKKWRYKARYFGTSGLFVRREVYHALGGFQPDDTLADYAFACRMEEFGPTLYLPDVLLLSDTLITQSMLTATLSWLGIQILTSLRIPPDRLAWLAAKSWG